MKRVIIIHGWEGVPHDTWKPWLKKELEKRGFEVVAPQMPGGIAPKLQEWLSTIAELVGKLDTQTFFVGHSLGCIAIIRYLATLPRESKAGGCVFIAGFSSDLGTPEIAEFYTSPAEVAKAKTHAEKFTVIYSDNDDKVPMEKSVEFKNQLDAVEIIEHNKKHINEAAGIKKLPSALKALVAMST